jgi:hypothetical protein
MRDAEAEEEGPSWPPAAPTAEGPAASSFGVLRFLGMKTTTTTTTTMMLRRFWSLFYVCDKKKKTKKKTKEEAATGGSAVKPSFLRRESEPEAEQTPPG